MIISADQLAAKWRRCACVLPENTACSQGGRGGGTNGFLFTPACSITSGAFLDRLRKGKAAEGDGSLYRPSASVPPDRGNHISASFTSQNTSAQHISSPYSFSYRWCINLFCLFNDSFYLCVVRWTLIFITEASGSARQPKSFESCHNWCPKCGKVHIVQSAPWQKGFNCLFLKPAK